MTIITPFFVYIIVEGVRLLQDGTHMFEAITNIPIELPTMRGILRLHNCGRSHVVVYDGYNLYVKNYYTQQQWRSIRVRIPDISQIAVHGVDGVIISTLEGKCYYCDSFGEEWIEVYTGGHYVSSIHTTGILCEVDSNVDIPQHNIFDILSVVNNELDSHYKLLTLHNNSNTSGWLAYNKSNIQLSTDNVTTGESNEFLFYVSEHGTFELSCGYSDLATQNTNTTICGDFYCSILKVEYSLDSNNHLNYFYILCDDTMLYRISFSMEHQVFGELELVNKPMEFHNPYRVVRKEIVDISCVIGIHGRYVVTVDSRNTVKILDNDEDATATNAYRSLPKHIINFHGDILGTSNNLIG